MILACELIPDVYGARWAIARATRRPLTLRTLDVLGARADQAENFVRRAKRCGHSMSAERMNFFFSSRARLAVSDAKCLDRTLSAGRGVIRFTLGVRV
jgi:hypothetical protein